MGLFPKLALGAVALACLAAGGAYAYLDHSVSSALAPDDPEPIVFEVPKGTSLKRIGQLLAEQGLISNPWVWQIHSRLRPGPEAKAGKHALKRSMTLAEIRLAITEPPLPDDIPVTIVEGMRIIDIDASLAEKGLITKGAYAAAARDPSRFRVPEGFEGKDLEGYLFPETYMMKRSEALSVDALIERQLDAFREKFAVPFKQEIIDSKRSLHSLVIVASMLEREEPKPAVRPKVAGVFYKRLDGGWPLGVDATSRYTLSDWSDRRLFLKQLRDESDPYNTRLRPGLPLGPIGSPSLPSLTAALRPESSKFWYYLHDKDQNIHFAKNAEEHEKNRKKYDVY